MTNRPWPCVAASFSIALVPATACWRSSNRSRVCGPGLVPLHPNGLYAGEDFSMLRLARQMAETMNPMTTMNPIGRRGVETHWVHLVRIGLIVIPRLSRDFSRWLAPRRPRGFCSPPPTSDLTRYAVAGLYQRAVFGTCKVCGLGQVGKPGFACPLRGHP